MKRWTAARMSCPRAVEPDAAAPANTRNTMTTIQTVSPRRGVEARATDEM